MILKNIRNKNPLKILSGFTILLEAPAGVEPASTALQAAV